MGQVAPRTGAWIETPVPSMSSLAASSRPARARGLKHQKGAAIAQAIQSRPARARGLKQRRWGHCPVPARRAPHGRVD